MNPTRRILRLLAEGAHLVRGPGGWRIVAGAGFERVGNDTAREIVAQGWVSTDAAGIVFDITDEGATALEETT